MFYLIFSHFIISYLVTSVSLLRLKIISQRINRIISMLKYLRTSKHRGVDIITLSASQAREARYPVICPLAD